MTKSIGCHNPLRAGIVKKLADYPWSSYRFYAYKKKPPVWLKTAPVLNQMSAENRTKAYRIKVQQYADEQSSPWADLRHGLICGGQDFVEKIKTRFLGDRKDAELPQHNRLFRAFDPEALLQDAAKALNFDLEAARNAKKISASEKDKRDLLVHLLWKSAQMSNQEIGACFKLTYSSISKIVSSLNARMQTEKHL